MPRRVAIMGAAGRDFHDFNTTFRDDPEHEVVAFTAEQIPGIDDRRYPPELAGELYPDGIPIRPAADLEEIIDEEEVDEVALSYSDLRHEYVMHQASRALAAGADFRLLGPGSMQLEAEVPVLAVCAVRTGCGKSGATRLAARTLENEGLEPVVVRHPMPYGDLAAMEVQRFETREDLDRHRTTVEEREEYEGHIEEGRVVYAGVDYEKILREAEQEADAIIWDGGNNDLPFYRPDLHVVLADPLRVGDETRYHPGETNLRSADAVVINKVDAASGDATDAVRENVHETNPDAEIVEAASPVRLEDPGEVKGRRVLVVEDGPTVTHGGMSHGAGYVAARKHGAEILDPRTEAEGEIAELYAEYPHLGPVLPAFGYSEQQLNDLETTLNRLADQADAVILGTPSNLTKIIDIHLPVHRTSYELQSIGEPTLEGLVKGFAEGVEG